MKLNTLSDRQIIDYGLILHKLKNKLQYTVLSSDHTDLFKVSIQVII